MFVKDPIQYTYKSSISSADVVNFLSSVQHLRYQEVTPENFEEFCTKFYKLFFSDYSVFSNTGSLPLYYDGDGVSLLANTPYQNIALGCVFNLYVKYPDSEPFVTQVDCYIDGSQRVFFISGVDNPYLLDTVYSTDVVGEKVFHPLKFVYNGILNAETLIEYRDFDGNYFSDYFLHAASLVCSSFTFSHPRLMTAFDNLFPNSPNHSYSFVGEFGVYGTYSSGNEFGGTGLCPLDSGNLISDMQVDFGESGFALVDLSSSYYQFNNPISCASFSIDCDSCADITNAFRSIYKIVSNLGLLTNGGDDEDMDYTLQLNSIAQSLQSIDSKMSLIDDEGNEQSITDVIKNSEGNTNLVQIDEACPPFGRNGWYR